MPELPDRERRLHLELDLEVRGRDRAGAAFVDSGVTVNVSSGAVCFETGRRHEIGAPVEVEIALPEPLRRHFGGRATYRSRAVVYRLEPAGSGWRVVARFVEADASTA